LGFTKYMDPKNMRLESPRLFINLPALAALVATLSFLTLGSSIAYGQETELKGHNGLHVAHGWARASLGQNPNSSAYVTVHNLGDATDRLMSLSCAGAKRCSLHNHVTEDGIMKMRAVETLKVGAGKHIAFKPGGYHIMLFDVSAPLQAGTTTTIVFSFEKAGDISVDVDVLTLRDSAKMGSHEEGDDHKKKGGKRH
jgi:periplasmic copper chaperone A